MSCVATASCASEFAESLFDRSFHADRPREGEHFLTASNLFDFLPDLSRQLKQEFTPRPEEDLERWDGLS